MLRPPSASAARPRWPAPIVAGAAFVAACSFDPSGVPAGDGGGDDDGDAGFVDAGPDAGGGPLGAGEARLWFGTAPSVLQARRFVPAPPAWIDEGRALAAAGLPRWLIVEAAAPAAADAELELVAVGSIQAGAPVLQVFSSSAPAIPELSLFVLGDELAYARGFDVAIEAESGDALLVIGNGTPTPAYAVRQAGVWSELAPLPINDADGPAVNTGAAVWIELASDPRTDVIGLAYADALGTLGAILWDGAAWRASSTAVLSGVLHRNPLGLRVDNRVFDLAFEDTTGDLVVAWGIENVIGFGAAQHDSSSDAWDPPVFVAAPTMGEVSFVDLAAQPGTDRVLAGLFDLGDQVERLGVAAWEGTVWEDALELDSQARDWNDLASGRSPGAVGWAGGVGLCVYADDTAGKLDWASWTPDAGWTLEPDLTLAGKGHTDSVLLFPTSSDGLVAVLVDDFALLFSAVYAAPSWTALSPLPLSPALAVEDGLPFGVAAR